ncbi:MAG: hypothetical protein ACKO1M_11340 [Planctomycetota bacterium]
MARRRTREQAARPRRRLGVFSLAALAVLAAAGWLAPAVLVHTSLRDRPLEAALAGIDGTVTSRVAHWRWLGGIEYRDIVLSDAAGRPAVLVPSLVIEKGLLGLALDPRNLGTIRLSGAEAIVAVRAGGSSLEDILAPWLAKAAGGVACQIELVEGMIELVDTAHADAWRITDLIAVGTLAADGSLAGWTAAGRVRHAGRSEAVNSASNSPPDAPVRQDATAARDPLAPPSFDRTTLPAAAAAALARDGGWSVSAPAPAAGGGRSLAITTHRLPLGISSVAATRFGLDWLADGLADVRLDVASVDQATQVQGRAVVEQFAVCDAATLVEQFALERCELPLDVVLDARGITIRECRAISPVAEAELSGRVPLPGHDPWAWLEAAVTHDCAAAARIDLAAAARALPGGLVVRDDVQVTGGSLQLSAVARADGADRLLEVRLDARNLAAVRQAAPTAPPPDGSATEEPVTEATKTGERLLRWSEPLTAWIRGRRGPGREAGLRIEEARVASQAAEISATGTPAALRAEWTVDLGGLVGELSEVLDFGGMRLAGKARGRLDAERAGGGVTAVKLAAAFTDFELASPGRPAWQDESLALDAELVGSLSGNLAAIERARGVLASAGDSLEVSLAGGVLVDTAAVTGGRRAGSPAAWVRPAAAGGEVTADCGIFGDLGRWHRRLAAALPGMTLPGLELAGAIEATAAVTPAPAAGGDAWRITKAGGAIERFALRLGDRQVSEPRIVATAAGLVRPSTGAIEVSSAEVLSSSLSIRSGGATWAPAQAAPDSLLDAVMTSVRGRVQWQADLSRLADWMVPRGVAAGWPLSGRTWGTLDVAETQLGVNMLAEATGSELAIARRSAQGESRGVWAEPQATLVLEVTRPYARVAAGGLTTADRLVVDRVALESSTVAVAARGTVEEWSGRRLMELTGSLSYDWGQLSRLATPWTGGKVRLAGVVNRPFAVRAPLGLAAPAGVSVASTDTPPASGTLPLPDAWLAATRGADQAAGDRPTATVPVKAASARRLEERLKAVSLDTSAAWTAADIDGFSLAAGDVAVRLVEGQLAFGPFELAAAGGRLRGAPWIALTPAPGELVVPPGRIVERVQLTGELCSRFASWISPLLGRSTEASGMVSIDTAGVRLPLADPLAGEAGAQVVFERFEVLPSGAMQPLVTLLGKLQAVVDPRFALADKPVLLRVRPEPIRVRLAERRIWHDGLVMDSGALVVTSKGSVGADGSLAMLVEVAFRGDLVGQTPVVATLARTPIAIPLKGTLARPEFDAAAIDILIKRLLENTAQAVINDGIGRGLEAIFGAPPPPPSGPPAPLTLPR